MSDVFEGQLQSTLTCSACGTHSHSFEVFQDLSLPPPTISSPSAPSVQVHPSSTAHARALWMHPSMSKVMHVKACHWMHSRPGRQALRCQMHRLAHTITCGPACRLACLKAATHMLPGDLVRAEHTAVEYSMNPRPAASGVTSERLRPFQRCIDDVILTPYHCSIHAYDQGS